MILFLLFFIASPRFIDALSTTHMMLAPRDAMRPLAAPIFLNDLATNTLSWTGSFAADGYMLYQYSGGTTNTYPCSTTSLTIVYHWPDAVPRWFYYVTATNEWGESDPSPQIFFPPYQNDRMDLYVTGVGAFNLESSIDRKNWSSQMVTGKTTVLFVGAQRFFRVKGMRLKCEPYNPLNQ